MKRGRSLCSALAPLVIPIVLSAGVQGPASSSTRTDLLRELAGKVAAAAGATNTIVLSTTVLGSARRLLAGSLDDELASLLRARGVRLAASGAAAAQRQDAPWQVRVTCAISVTDLVCSAELLRAEVRTVVLASRPLASLEREGAEGPLISLVARPLFAQRAPVLDAVKPDERRLLVLDVHGVTLYEATDDGWQRLAAQELAPAAWPRDPRGRLAAAGGGVEAFVPGMACRGSLEPLSLQCHDGRAPWPIGIENDGLREGRNFFTSPRTAPFFTAAQLPGGDATGWVTAGVDGRLRVLDASLRETFVTTGYGDAVTPLNAKCGTRRGLVVLSISSGVPTDALCAYEMSGRELTPVSSALVLPGRLSALWPMSDDEALAVVRNPESQRYELFQVGVACVR